MSFFQVEYVWVEKTVNGTKEIQGIYFSDYKVSFEARFYKLVYTEVILKLYT